MELVLGRSAEETALAEQEQPKYEGPERRRDSDLVSTVRAVDAGVSMGWRWASILATIACAIFVAGVTYAGFAGMKEEIRGLRADVAKVQDSQASSDKQGALDRQNIQRLDSDTERRMNDQDGARKLLESRVIVIEKDVERLKAVNDVKGR